MSSFWSLEEKTEMIPAASALFPPGQSNQAFHIINNKKCVTTIFPFLPPLTVTER